MSYQIADVDLTVFNLPKDGPEAEERFLSLLHDPGETWGAFYGFTLPDLMAEIEEDDAAGTPFHLLLDESQGRGHYEAPEIAGLVAKLTHSDVTLTTAGPLSRNPREIMHRKTMVVAARDGGPAWCWVGSVNPSGKLTGGGGWDQANDALLFRSDVYASDFIQNFFLPTRAWAKTHVKQLG